MSSNSLSALQRMHSDAEKSCTRYTKELRELARSKKGYEMEQTLLDEDRKVTKEAKKEAKA